MRVDVRNTLSIVLRSIKNTTKTRSSMRECYFQFQNIDSLQINDMGLLYRHIETNLQRESYGIGFLSVVIDFLVVMVELLRRQK